MQTYKTVRMQHPARSHTYTNVRFLSGLLNKKTVTAAEAVEKYEVSILKILL